mmetsp:Transcript_12577/g.20756  ORF Transcript_12577/g.20756 Transcript_12577/m.20756 type:complete len:214 (+) Transcript_12577:75-716(+)
MLAIPSLTLMVWDAAMASRIELIMFAVTCLAYIALRFIQNDAVDAHNGPKGVAKAQKEEPNESEDACGFASKVRFHLKAENLDQACDIFELDFARFCDEEIDEDLEWDIMVAALRVGRTSVAKQLYETSQANIGNHVATIQKWWRRVSTTNQEERILDIGNVLNRLSHVFQERFPFEEFEHSDDESTCYFSEEGDSLRDCDSDSSWSYCDEVG